MHVTHYSNEEEHEHEHEAVELSHNGTKGLSKALTDVV